MDIDNGIKEQDRKSLAKTLSRVLADSYLLYIKTHGFHWNVEGPMFNTLHQMFEEQYNDLFLAVDEIAERIRALGVQAPASYKSFSSLSSIKESDKPLSATDMIKELLIGQDTVVRSLREAVLEASEAGDEATADLATGRLKRHEKVAWMLRSLLES